MGTNFGAETDHFSLASSDLILQESSKVEQAESRGDALDENNDIAAATWYGNTDVVLYDASCTYVLKSSTLNLNTLDLGEISTGVFISTIEAATENAGWPILTVTGVLGASAMVAPTGFLTTFSLPSLTLTAIKQAQELGFTTGAYCKLTASSFAANCEFARVDDGDGEAVAFGVSGAFATGTGTFVRITAAPSWTVTLTGASETAAPGEEEPQAAYHTGTGTYEVIISRDAAP